MSFNSLRFYVTVATCDVVLFAHHFGLIKG